MAKRASGGFLPEALSFASLGALRAGGEGRAVQLGLVGCTLGVVVGLEGAGQGVGDGHHDLHVRQAGGVDPVVVVEAAGVDRLDHHLDVGRVENQR